MRTRLVLLLVAAGCGAPEKVPRRAPAAPPPGLAGDAGPKIGSQPGTGIPHAALIDQIEIAPDATAALTRDALGSWRIWAALDGTAQPQVGAVRGARQGAVARRADGGLLVAFIDSAGGLHLVRTGRGGRAGRAPVPVGFGRSYLHVRVLAGGERAVAVRDDHRVELLAADGRILASLEERGFRPSLVELAAAPDRGIAISVEPGQKSHDVLVHRLALEGAASGAPRLALGPDPLRLTAPAALGPGQVSLAPGGARLAFLSIEPAGPPNTTVASWKLQVADLEAETSRAIDLPFQQHEKVAVGFVSDRTLVAISGTNQTSWRVELDRKDGGDLFPHVTPGSQTGTMASAFAAGTHLSAVGTWLHVHRLDGDPLYLGYDRFEPVWGALSPTGNRVAWASQEGGVFIRSLGGERMTYRNLRSHDPRRVYNRVHFVDEEHVLVGDSTGTLRLIEWQTGRERSAVDVSGSMLDAEVDTRRGLVRVTRRNGQTWLFRVTGKRRLRGPFIVGDGSTRSGLLDGAGDLLWTLDASNRLRTYKLAEIERSIPRGELAARGVAIAHSTPSTIDRQGRYYLFETNGRTAVVRRFDGPSRASASITYTTPVAGHAVPFPSPDGSLLALRRADNAISVYGDSPDRPLWSRPFVAHVHHVGFSPDGSRIAVASHLGGAVLDARTGDPIDLTCGPSFEVRPTAPVNPLPVLNQASLCESAWSDDR